MSGVHLPPAEPPAPEVLEVRERLTAAWMYLNDAQRLLELLRRQLADDAAETEHRTHLVIEVDLAERRVDRWVGHVDRLEARARALGLTP